MGVGSVGLVAVVVLLLGAADDDPLFLQVKQAEASVLERFLDRAASRAMARASSPASAASRPRATSSSAGPSAAGRHLYVRQLQDQKGGAVIDAMTVDDLAAWGELCGWALARGHARSGEPAEIAGYLGDDDAFDHALGRLRRGLRRPERARPRGVRRRDQAGTAEGRGGHLSVAGPVRGRAAGGQTPPLTSVPSW